MYPKIALIFLCGLNGKLIYSSLHYLIINSHMKLFEINSKIISLYIFNY